jgi:hypothetical protein
MRNSRRFGQGSCFLRFAVLYRHSRGHVQLVFTTSTYDLIWANWLGYRLCRFRVIEPVVGQAVTIRVLTSGGAQRHWRSNLCSNGNRFLGCITVHDNNRVMIRILKILHCPVHPGRKIMLECLSPTPDRRLIRRIALTVYTGDSISRVRASGKVAARQGKGCHCPKQPYRRQAALG